MHNPNPSNKNLQFMTSRGCLLRILKLSFFPLVLVLFSCESNSQKESKLVLAMNPWLKPFIFNAPKIVSKASDSIAMRHFKRIGLWYEKDTNIGQKLFPRIDSAAIANGWIETDLRASDKFIDNKTYWKNWHGENGISGQYNLIVWFCCVNSIVFDLQLAPSDSAILHNVKLAHDFLRDDPSDKKRNRSFFVRYIGRYLSMLPQDHHLYKMLDAEFENSFLHDPADDIRISGASFYSEWRLKSKFRRADSLLELACGDSNRKVRLYAAMGLMRLGDYANSKASQVLIDFALGTVLNEMSESELLGIWYPELAPKAEQVLKAKQTLRREAIDALRSSSAESAKRALERLKADTSSEIRKILGRN